MLISHLYYCLVPFTDLFSLDLGARRSEISGGIWSQVVSSKQPKPGLTQEFSRISESTAGYTFIPCVGSFTSPGIDTR